ncbi:MAG: hypothetical protein ACTHLP_16620 [Rhizobiaceae bacterium]
MGDKNFSVALGRRTDGPAAAKPIVWKLAKLYSVASPDFVAGAFVSGAASFFAASPVAFDTVALMLATVIGSG